MMTVHEVAEYLRIKDRKVYDLVAQKQIPCTRVTGKWLFPKYLIDLWLMKNSEFQAQPGYFTAAPPVIVGSHDPLLEWALRESGFPLAMKTTGSLEGLSRFAAGEAALCGIHLLDTESGEYNVPYVKNILQDHDIVVLEWAWRQQGLILASGNPLGIQSIADLASKQARVIERQTGSGGQVLFLQLLERADTSRETLALLPHPARSETDIGLAISSGKADAGVACAAVANQLQLDFLPLVRERFDLVIRRRDYFEPPFQKLLCFIRTATFIEQADEMGGYDISNLGAVKYNSP